MERKDFENWDNFFVSLNQFILSLEFVIKEVGLVLVVEDILIYLEVIDENFYRFVNLGCFVFVVLCLDYGLKYIGFD